MPAQWVDIPLATGQGEEVAGGASYVSDAELVNLEVRRTPPGSRKPFFVASAPGLSTTGIALGDTGKIRAWSKLSSDGVYYAIQGTTILAGDPSGTFADSGLTLAGSQYLKAVDVEEGIAISDPANTSTDRVITALAVTTPSVTGFIDVTYQDGFTFWLKKTGALYASALDAPATIDALDFTTVDGVPGKAVGCISSNRALYALKDHSVEHYYNAGRGGFPFSRSSPGVIERGAWDTFSVAKGGGAIFWLGNDLRAYMMDGLSPRAISTPWVEKYIKAKGPSAFGLFCRVGGSDYYVLSGFSDSGTITSLVYNIDLGLWHIRKSPLTGGVRHTHVAVLDGSDTVASMRGLTVLAGNSASDTVGALYWFDQEKTNDAGAASETTRVMTLPQFAPAGGRRVAIYALELDMQKAAAAGTCNLQWSDDGGTTYSTAVAGTATNPVTRWSRLGQFRQRIFRFTFAAASKVAIMGARALIEVRE